MLSSITAQFAVVIDDNISVHDSILLEKGNTGRKKLFALLGP